MDLATVSMDRTEAREAFLAYRRAVRERHDAEDEQIMRGYRELARGRNLIRLSETLRAGGTTEVEVRWRGGFPAKLRVERVLVPRLAAVRADARMAWTRGIDREGRLELLTQHPHEIAMANRRNRHRFGGFGEDQERLSTWRWIRAIVPTVPPPLRPAHHLRNYMILWEAEWSPEPQPPADPALLKYIGGDLYAVVAVWDLTEVERAVLALRA